MWIFSDLDKVSSGGESRSCLKETKRRMGRRLGMTRSGNPSTRTNEPAMETAGVAQFEYGTGNISLTGDVMKVCSPCGNALW